MATLHGQFMKASYGFEGSSMMVNKQSSMVKEKVGSESILALRLV